jgi:hypothetical protein
MAAPAIAKHHLCAEEGGSVLEMEQNERNRALGSRVATSKISVGRDVNRHF